MIYNLANELDRRRFAARVERLTSAQAVVELTEKAPRSINQNSYLHLILGVVAMETGNTLEDTKRVYFKQLCNPGIFCQEKTDDLGNKVDTLRSSADVTKEEMSTAIDRFKMWAASNGIYIPEPGDEELLREIEYQMGRMKTYL